VGIYGTKRTKQCLENACIEESLLMLGYENINYRRNFPAILLAVLLPESLQGLHEIEQSFPQSN
jgi:hypothetical protein